MVERDTAKPLHVERGVAVIHVRSLRDEHYAVNSYN